MEEFKTVHFFGDKIDIGGNDFEIFNHDRTEGHAVKTFHDTIRILNQIFKLGIPEPTTQPPAGH